MDTDEECYDVVISGISGRFPSCSGLEELKGKLLEKENLVTDDDCRWNKDDWKKVPSATGKINVVRKFDDTFFGIYSGVASMMDPLTRVSIERAFEAIMDAGINPKTIRGSNTGVYTNSCISDSEAVGCDEKLTAKFWLLAHVRALLANRISYVLNLQGPSWTIDANWIGGMECLKQAVHDIKVGRIDSALVGASNVIVFPDLSQHWKEIGKLSADGSCHPFQEDASGYGRSESVVMLYLQRATEAKRIYATVSHTDASFCGDKALTLLKPSEEAFVDFFQKFYADCKVPIRDVVYLEADGSADKYLDEVELNSIGEVLCKEREERLYVGSVKSNLGHTEGASSLVSVAKTLICLDSGVIPPNIDFQNANKNIKKLNTNEMNIVTNSTTFPEGKFAAVNALGLCTSVGHVLLKPNPKAKKLVTEKNWQIPRLVLLSARHESGILNSVEKLESMPYDAEYFTMINDVFKESMNGHFYRGFTILGATEKRIHFTLESGTPHKRPVWFVFAGMGSQWPGMGADLMHLPVFANSIKEIDAYLQPLGIDIIDVITNFDPTVLRNVVHSFVGIAAIQIGMVDVLKSVGIEPDGMFGHSLGENGCAYADGCFTKYQTIMAAYFRGKASSEIQIEKGLMVAVGLGYDQIKNLPENVQIACHNSVDSTTISGPYEEVQLFMNEMKRQNVFVRAVNSNFVAYHSKHVKPLAPFVLENIRKATPNPKKRSSRWISTSIPEEDWNSPLAETSSAEYHVNNFLTTVYFAEACAHVPEEAIVIEISPHGLFQGILKRSLPETCFNIPLGKREISSPLNFLLSSIGKLYVVGLQTDVNALYPPIEYPVSRGTPSIAELATWNHETDWELNVYNEKVKKPTEISLRDRKWRFLTGYKINQKVLMSFSILMLETLNAYETNDPILVFENVNIKKFIEITAKDHTKIYTQVQYGSGNFEITTENDVIMDGIIRYSQENVQTDNEDYTLDNTINDFIAFSEDEIQNVFKQYGMEFSEQFSSINEMVLTEDGYQATVTWEGSLSFIIITLTHTKMFYDLCITGKGPILPSTFHKLAVEVEKYNSMEAGATLHVWYNKHTNIIKAPGIELFGLENVQHPLAPAGNELFLQNLRFVSHNNPETKNVESFLNLCGQIVGETFYTEAVHNLSFKSATINVIITNDLYEDKNQVEFLLETLYREIPRTQLSVTYVDSKEFKNDRKNGNTHSKYFIICKSIKGFSDKCLEFVRQAEEVFILSLEKMSDVLQDFVQITKEKIHPYNMVLWKKKVTINQSIIKIAPYSNENWLEDLEEYLYGIKMQKSVIIQWNAEHIIDVINVINQISTIGPCHILRYIVMLDGQLAESASNSAAYREQLEKGLVMNIFKNNEWGSIRHLSVTNLISLMSNLEKFSLQSEKIENIDVHYTSINGSVMKSQEEFDINYFAFSGTVSDNSKVMGIADYQKGTCKPEVLLEWPVPERWTLEDAVTVPLAYVKAYYALAIRGKIRAGYSVLVHSGFSVIGEAIITIALNSKCTVFTTVRTHDQLEYIRGRFQNSAPHLYTFIKDSHQIDVEVLKITHGNGVNIVINAETERELQQSVACIRKYGNILQLTPCRADVNAKIGMEMFLKSTAFYGLTNMDVLMRESKDKQEITNLIQESLKHNIIKPFQRLTYESGDDQQINKILKKHENSHSIVIKYKSSLNVNNGSFLCDPNKCYLIIGNRTEIWFGIITWLLENNAKKLVLIEDNSNEREYNLYQKRFSILIQNYSDLSLMHLPASVINHKDEACSMIQNVNKFSKLDVVFCISLNANQVSNINLGLSKCVPSLRQLLCLQCDASKICESRHKLQLPALNIIWDRSITEAVVLNKNIEKLMNSSLRMNSSLIYIADSTQFASKSDNVKLSRTGQFLPTYSELEHLSNGFAGLASFEKVVSRCSHYSSKNQLFPVFVIPGLHSNRLLPLIKKLMYPVFCAKVPSKYSSAKNIAQSLIKPLKDIQPVGPYTLVGETWSGAIAMELTSLLEENYDDRVQLILLEGIPKDMQRKLSTLGAFGSSSFLDNLCEICFENKKIMKQLQKEHSKQNSSNGQITFLELLQRKLTTTHHYAPTNVNLRNKVIAIKLSDPSVLSTYINFEEHYGQELDLKLLEEDNYNSLIDSKVVANIINDNVLFKW